jgi:hypothetical protein
MLKLGSVRDFPEVFAARRLQAVLTDDELAAWPEVTGFYGQRDWLLRRLLLKDLASAWLGSNHRRYVPANALEVRETPGGFALYALLVSREAPVLHARCATDGEVGVALVAPDLGSARFGLKLRRIARTYPFLVDARLTAGEEALLRAQSESELDTAATLLVTAKRLCAELLPEVTDPEAMAVQHIDGDDRVYFDRERLVLPAPLDGALFQSWHWDDYVIVAGLLFETDRCDHGFDPFSLFQWV